MWTYKTKTKTLFNKTKILFMQKMSLDEDFRLILLIDTFAGNTKSGSQCFKLDFRQGLSENICNLIF